MNGANRPCFFFQWLSTNLAHLIIHLPVKPCQHCIQILRFTILLPQPQSRPRSAHTAGTRPGQSARLWPPTGRSNPYTAAGKPDTPAADRSVPALPRQFQHELPLFDDPCVLNLYPR